MHQQFFLLALRYLLNVCVYEFRIDHARLCSRVEKSDTVKRSLRVGKGIGPRTCAPVRLAVSTISAVA